MVSSFLVGSTRLPAAGSPHFVLRLFFIASRYCHFASIGSDRDTGFTVIIRWDWLTLNYSDFAHRFFLYFHEHYLLLLLSNTVMQNETDKKMLTGRCANNNSLEGSKLLTALHGSFAA